VCTLKQRMINKCVALLCLLPWLALAQTEPDEPVIWQPNSGNTWVDQQLIDMNAYAQRYPDAFIDEIVRYGGGQREMAQALLHHGWVPGDIWFACFWAQVIELHCNELLQLRQSQRHAPWESILQQLAVKPENHHYRALRHALVASFDHWQRPITLDALLQQQLGNRTQRDARARQRHSE